MSDSHQTSETADLEDGSAFVIAADGGQLTFFMRKDGRGGTHLHRKLEEHPGVDPPYLADVMFDETEVSVANPIPANRGLKAVGSKKHAEFHRLINDLYPGAVPGAIDSLVSQLEIIYTGTKESPQCFAWVEGDLAPTIIDNQRKRTEARKEAATADEGTPVSESTIAAPGSLVRSSAPDEDSCFINPYTFVPFPQEVTRGVPPGHHRLASDRYSGRIDLGWKTVTPILLPSQCDADSVTIMPGSSIRGATRSLHETVANGCLRIFDESFVPVYRKPVEHAIDLTAGGGRRWTLARVAKVSETGIPRFIPAQRVVWAEASKILNVMADHVDGKIVASNEDNAEAVITPSTTPAVMPPASARQSAHPTPASIAPRVAPRAPERPGGQKGPIERRNRGDDFVPSTGDRFAFVGGSATSNDREVATGDKPFIVDPKGTWRILVSDGAARGRESYYLYALAKDGENEVPLAPGVWDEFRTLCDGTDDVRVNKIAGIEPRFACAHFRGKLADEISYGEHSSGTLDENAQAQGPACSHGRLKTHEPRYVGRRRVLNGHWEGALLWVEITDIPSTESDPVGGSISNAEITDIAVAIVWRERGGGPALQRLPGAQLEEPSSLLPCQNHKELCPSCQIFGAIDPGTSRDSENQTGGAEQNAYASHVRFGPARRGDATPVNRGILGALLGPNPGFGSFYLKPGVASRLLKLSAESATTAPRGQWQESDGSSSLKLRQLKGRKYYWHADPNPPRHDDASGKRATGPFGPDIPQAPGQWWLTRTVDRFDRAFPALAKDGSDAKIRDATNRHTYSGSFSSSVTFENLTRPQIGSLLAALDTSLLLTKYGGRSQDTDQGLQPDFASRLGGAKPLGLGSVKARVDGLQLWSTERYAAETKLGKASGPQILAQELVDEFAAIAGQDGNGSASAIGMPRSSCRPQWEALAHTLDLRKVDPDLVGYPPATVRSEITSADGLRGSYKFFTQHTGHTNLHELHPLPEPTAADQTLPIVSNNQRRRDREAEERRSRAQTGTGRRPR